LSVHSIASDSERETFQNKQFTKDTFLIRFIFSLKMRKNNYICQLIGRNAKEWGAISFLSLFFE